MKEVTNRFKDLLASPFAGVYTFVALFILAILTGERDPMGLILGRVFPPEGAFGASLAELRDLSAPSPDQIRTAQWVLLVRHSDSATYSVQLIDSQPEDGTRLAVGSLEGIVVPRPVEGYGAPRPLAELSLPGHSVASVLISGEHIADGRFSLLTPTMHKLIPATGDLHFLSENELRNIRAVYLLFIVAAATVGLTLPRYTRLRSPTTKDEASTSD
jgi:hypothetical protein